MVARYEEVAQSLARRIEDTTYPLGSQLPPEVELASTYAVSRSTVRSALDSLENLGLISRKRRTGTRVEATRPTTGYARTVTTMNELVQYSVETRRTILGRDDVVADNELSDRLGCTPGRQWAHFRMLRLDGPGDEVPLCYTDVYLDPAAAHVVGDRLERPDGLINEIVEQCTGQLTVRVEQRIRACSVPAELADLLGVQVGSPALQIVRRYLRGSGDVRQVTVSIHPADRFEFTVSMDRPGL